MNLKSKIYDFISKNKTEVIILILILLIGAFFRLYKIESYMTFLGDEGRDVIIVRRLLTEGHTPLIGPGTSVGNMYLGPLYYYMMAPALWLSGFSPVGPAVQIAILGVITIWFIWYVFREWFPAKRWGALIAAGLYAISPTVITFSHSSWNPNIMPFFSLLSMYSIWKVYTEHKFNWLLVLGVSFAAVVQSHYLGLLLLPTLIIFWFLSKVPMRYTLYASAIFLVIMSPLFLFDLRHNWMNTKAFYAFIADRQTTFSYTPTNSFIKFFDVFNQINTALIGGKNVLAGQFASAIIFVSAVLLAFQIKSKKKLINESSFFIISFWMIFGLIGFSVYKQPIYDHYFGFLFVVPYTIIGITLSTLFQKKFLLKVVGFVLLIFFVISNLLNNPFIYAPNNQLKRAKDVAQKTLDESSGKPFDLAVLAERNYEDGYRYFMELWGGKVLHADVWDKTTIADQLFVVCEMEESKCDPTHSPKAEVANFGWSKIDNRWAVDGVILYKLSHSVKQK